MLIGFYPYLTLGAIIETKEYLYFIATTGTNIVPKSIIPQEIKENVLKIIKKIPAILRKKVELTLFWRLDNG